MKTKAKQTGFTLIELLVVVAIIGVLASVVMISVNEARIKSRDAARVAQANEVLKAVELYFTENGFYPDDDGGVVGPAVQLSSVGAIGNFMPQTPIDLIYGDTANGYLYCASVDLQSMAIWVNTEDDQGGSNHCVVSRGPQEYTNSVCTNLAAQDRCSTRL